MRKRSIIIAGWILLIAIPLLGGHIKGFKAGFFHYPPLLEESPNHAPFSWLVFLSIGLLVLLTAGCLLFPKRAGFKVSPPLRDQKRSASFSPGLFPLWGWIGFILLVFAWITSWASITPWLPLRHHAFAPLWLGYILLIDAFVYRRTGSSLCAHYKKTFLLLFPYSALAWWYFEWLNRFVENWWYEGVEHWPTGRYLIHATVCFSTVLPAVLETQLLISTTPWIQHNYTLPATLRNPPIYLACFSILLGATGLFLMPFFPEPLFFITWVAPLAILGGILIYAKEPNCFSPIANGDFRSLVSWSLAALTCGIFWEMWNFLSLPKWHYSIPYVQRWHLFEMPILGYSGYLPFGPICCCMWLSFDTLFLPRTTLLESNTRRSISWNSMHPNTVELFSDLREQ